MAVEYAPGAAAHPLGAGVLAALEARRTLVSWAVATDDIDAFLARTGCHPVMEEIAFSDGTRLSCRALGGELAVGSGVPAIVCWDEGQGHPQTQPVEHRVDPVGITSISLGADFGLLRSWLGPAVHDLPLKLLSGYSGLRAVAVATSIADVVVANRDGDGRSSEPDRARHGFDRFSTGFLPYCHQAGGWLGP